MSWGFWSILGPEHKDWETAAKAVLGDREIAVGEYFGRQSFASPVGMMTLFHSAGALISLAVSGRIFRQIPNHDLVLVKVSPLFLLPGAAFAPARRALPTIN